MRLLRDYVLHVLTFPQVQPLLPGTPLPAGYVEVLHDDDIGVITDGGLRDEGGGLYGYAVTDPLGISPQAGRLLCPAALRLLDPVHCVFQTVVFSWQGEELPRKCRLIS